MLSGRDEYGYYVDGLNSRWQDGPNVNSKHNLPEIDVVETFWSCKGADKYQVRLPPPLAHRAWACALGSHSEAHSRCSQQPRPHQVGPQSARIHALNRGASASLSSRGLSQ